MNEERVHTNDSDGLKLIAALRVHVPLLMDKHQTPGLNLAIADKGQLIWEGGFGLADIATGRRMTPDSVYHSGSLGKTYTATALMILVDRGVLTLEDPINKHLPFEVRNPLGERDITVHDLMVHMSGLSEDVAASSWTPGRSLAEDIAAEYAREWSPMHGGQLMKRWVHPVGVAWRYSNLGIATLGLIVETANPDQLTFSEFVQRHVMDPLGMTHSCYPPAQDSRFVEPKLWAQVTNGYSRMGGADIPSLPVYFREYPAGGVLGRPADHVRLLLAMMQGGELEGYRLFAPEIARAMISPATQLGALTSTFGNAIGEQGLVWRLNDCSCPWKSFDHSGGHMFGWRTEGRAWPSYKAALMVAVNQWSLPDDTIEVSEVADFVGTWLRYRQPGDALQLTSAALSYGRGALLAGAYRIACGIAEDVPEGALEAMIDGTRDRCGDWDAAAFRRGFKAVIALSPSLESLQSFWKAEACELDPATIRLAYAALGGNRSAGLLWKLLPANSG